jgi:uncharacterized LabA/DUF88 family protein
MLKAGIFVDAENVMRCGGWGMRYDVLKEFVVAQGASVVRANAYMAIDGDREAADVDYYRKKEAYRASLRGCGFKLVLKPVKTYRNEDGETVMKANSDLDLAIDALLQARNLDYLLLLSGDGDFVRLVIALQDRGCRVDVVAFHNVSRELREAADNFCSGFLLPRLLPVDDGRLRGYLHTVNEDKYFGWLTVMTGLGVADVAQDIFLHGNDLDEGRLSNRQFAELKGSHNVIEFSVSDEQKGRRAMRATRLRPVDAASPPPPRALKVTQSQSPAPTSPVPSSLALPAGTGTIKT